MRQYGLIGFPLSHSFSQKYFSDKFLAEKITDASYSLFPLSTIDGLLNLIATHPNLHGLNVTIPYKESIVPFLGEVSMDAKDVGAVNCIDIRNGKLIGYNTDVYGFENSLTNFLVRKPDVAFVLGTGGSSKAVQYVLKKLQMPCHVVSRASTNNTIQYSEITKHIQACNLFINTTPLGMFPDTDAMPSIPYELLTSKDFLFDLVYNPTVTEFLKQGNDKGCATTNGFEMLKMQAEKSWEIWNEEKLLS
jgi:shikimate dehydrogenase